MAEIDQKVDIEKIVRQVAEEVAKRLAMEVEIERTLAVFPDYVFDAAGIAKYLKTKTNVTCALFQNAEFGSEGCRSVRIESAEDRRILAHELKDYREVVIVTPPLSLLGTLAKGDDGVYEAMLAIRPLLWEKEVTVLLDFEAPKYKRNTAFSRIAEDVNALEAMGVKIASIGRKKPVREEEKDLVTEMDVKEAVKNETMRVKAAKGAIVTQLAEDAAKELGVTIER
jgi:hypothetical protein